MVTVIIPNYNGYTFLKDCLDALQPQLKQDMQVVVVDNGSTDQSRMLLESYEEIYRQKGFLLQNIFLQENTGFCGAVNAGIKASKTKYVILLNNDTKVLPGYIDSLVKAMEEDEKIFSASACMLQMHAPALVDDAGDEYCALGWAFARGKDKPAEAYREPKEVFASCGGAGIYRRAIFEEIGLFDENHFAYLEDIDIGYRAGIYGYRNIYVPKAKVLHYGSGVSGSRHNAFKVKLSSKNSVYLAWKNMPAVQLVLNAPFLAAGFLIKYLFFVKKGLGREYRQGFRDGLRLCTAKENRIYKVGNLGRYFKNYSRLQLLLWRNILACLRAF